MSYLALTDTPTDPQPGDPGFIGPVDTTGATPPITDSGSIYTLPVEIFDKIVPLIIQAGGVPTIPSPIPTTLPYPTYSTATAPGSVVPWLVVGLAAVAFLSPSKKGRK
jgi:hypothetical protein